MVHLLHRLYGVDTPDAKDEMNAARITEAKQ